MPKVLRVINRLNLGGPTYNAAYLSRYLGEDFETLLVAGEKDSSEASSKYITESLGLKPVIIPEMRRSLHPYYDLIALFKLISLIRKFKPDIVHTHAAKAGTIGRIAAWLCGVKKIYHTFHGHVFHSYFSKKKTQFFILIERFLARLSTKIIAISTIQKKELSEDYNICDSEKIHIIPLGFDLNRFSEDLDKKRRKFREKHLLSDDDIAIGIVGRLVPVKNHTFFLKIAKALLKTDTAYRFFIIGDGEELENLKMLCKDLKLKYSYIKPSNHPIVFTSWIKEMDVAYGGLDIVCLTSLNEGTPVSLIEAQAAGKHIVSTNVGGVKDINYSKNTFKIHNVGDQKSFISSIESFSKSASLKEPINKNDVKNFLNQYSYKRLCSDIRGLYVL
jgi:glycosyltransferase involved in cell wall biosynthesis